MSTRYGFVSTYPPTHCGLATFTSALRRALVSDDDYDRGPVVRLVEQPEPDREPEVGAQLVAGDASSRRRAVELLDECDVAIIQHEYGIYGGRDGDEVLPLLRSLRVPTIVVLHTVLSHPTEGQRAVLEAVVETASAVVTMTTTAREHLANAHRVDLSKVSVIPHGAAAPLPSVRPEVSVTPDRPTVLTWGLIGPGKGIEWAIRAIARLGDLDPAPRYVVAGQTHPKVRARDGEAYRERMQDLAHRLGIGDRVHLDDRYLDAVTLARLVDSAEVVLLPYDSTEQVTSGVLIEAVAAGTPVVATRFPHAVELLGGGAGLVVPQQDPIAMAAALRSVLTDDGVADRMRRVAGETAPSLQWPAVADRYRALVSQVTGDRVAA